MHWGGKVWKVFWRDVLGVISVLFSRTYQYQNPFWTSCCVNISYISAMLTSQLDFWLIDHEAWSSSALIFVDSLLSCTLAPVVAFCFRSSAWRGGHYNYSLAVPCPSELLYGDQALTNWGSRVMCQVCALGQPNNTSELGYWSPSSAIPVYPVQGPSSKWRRNMENFPLTLDCLIANSLFK